MRRLERDSCPFLLILTLLFRFCLPDLILPVPFRHALSLRAGFLAQLPLLPSRSDSDRPILAFSDSVARLRFLPPDARKKERKKTDTPNEGWDEDRVPTCTSRILEGRSGGQVGLSCS